MTGEIVQCPYCGPDGQVRLREGRAIPDGIAVCMTCYSTIEMDGRRTRIEVSGSDAKEVADVSRKLARLAATDRAEQRQMRSPWVTGSFYLAVLAVVFSVILVATQVVSAWVLPTALVAGLLFFMVVGAYQMRQDDKLSQKNFVSLMGDVLKQAALIVKAGDKKSTSSDDEAEPAS